MLQRDQIRLRATVIWNEIFYVEFRRVKLTHVVAWMHVKGTG